MRPPPKSPNTMYALEATEYAQQQGKFMEFHKAAYRGLWEDGKDLGDLAVIESIARNVDLDYTDMMVKLEDRSMSSTVISQYQQAIKLGVSGIPTFLVGNLLFTGAHPYSIFKSAMEKVLETG